MKGRLPFTFNARASKSDHHLIELSGFVLFALSVLGLYCLVLPQRAGLAGALLARSVTKGFGQGAYLLWFLTGYRGLRILFRREKREPWRYVLVDILLLAMACIFLTTFGTIFLDLNPGGYWGKAGDQVLTRLFGRWGAFFVATFSVSGLLFWRSGQRPTDVAEWLWNRLITDWREWREAVSVEKENVQKPAKRKALPKVFPSEPEASGKNKIQESKPVVHLKDPFTSSSMASANPPKIAAARRAETAQSATTSSDTEGEDIPYIKPSLDLLTPGDRHPQKAREEDLLASAQHLEKTLADFGIQGKVVEIHPGPIITRFDYTPAPGIKVQAVANLANDIALAMKALSVRIVAPIPGKSAVGIELPNVKRAIVRLREVLESEAFQSEPSKLAVGLGKDAEGHPYIADLASMPHLLIAGSTGSGKSVCIHALVTSLLYRSTPQEVKMLLIDPKRVELPVYDGIPHLYDPNQNPDVVRVITDSKEAAKALEGVVRVMDHRFKKLASVMARDIKDYNEKMLAEGRPIEPYIVVIIDELADLMAVSPKEVESTVQRLAQMARAVGIHLVLATQRPSVDVITGVIKANLPARLAFRVASQMDSRVILDGSGAESLLGQGDLLFLPPGAPKPFRLQCGYMSNKEVEAVADYARTQGKPSYERVLAPLGGNSGSGYVSSGNQELDDLHEGLVLVLERRRVSQDLLKAHFGSSARATNLLSVMEVKGFITKPEGTNRWTIYFDRIDTYLAGIKNQTPVA